MSIKVKCSFCKKELNKPGAVLWGPPYLVTVYNKNKTLMVKKKEVCDKYHICINCFNKTIRKVNLPLP